MENIPSQIQDAYREFKLNYAMNEQATTSIEYFEDYDIMEDYIEKYE